jgi:hypothetical protein
MHACLICLISTRDRKMLLKLIYGLSEAVAVGYRYGKS